MIGLCFCSSPTSWIGTNVILFLKVYLDDQAGGLVQSIQALVSSIRHEDDFNYMRSHISSISGVVDNVIASTESLFNSRSGHGMAKLGQRLNPMINTLDVTRNRLIETALEGDDDDNLDRQIHGTAPRLPPIAFDVARITRDLVRRLDRVDGEVNVNGGVGGDDDDFR